MEDIKKPGPWPTSLKWGIIGGLVIVVVSYLGSMSIDWTSLESIEAGRKSPLQYLNYVLLAAVIIIAQLEHKKKELGGFMSYGRSVGVATAVSIGTGILVAIYMYIFFGMIHPEFQQILLDGTLERMPEGTSPEQEEQMLSVMKMTTGPGAMAGFGFIGQVFVGLVIGLISGIFVQKSEE